MSAYTTLVSTDEIDVGRCEDFTDLDRKPYPSATIYLDVNEGGRGPNDREGYAMAHMTPTEARQLAADLVRLADEIEGKP